jgi:hypothetical protein
MSKEIKDYLHLYLGCECMTPKGIGKLFRYDIETNWTWCVFGIMGPEFEDSGHIENVKPILRPLSDMSEEEKIELKLNVVQASTINHASEIMWTFEQVRILLSKHFDLFNLIGEGLAIDKTTLKT